jgi:hypothetical protein
MPNDCYNILKLTDDPQKTREVIKPFLSIQDKEEIFDFNKVIKMPRSLKITSATPDLKTEEGKKLKKQQDKNLEKYGFKDWYDWCVSNWGTKWNSYSNTVNDDCVSFETAWAPPLPVIIELAEKTGKDWTLLYSEPGMDFCGKLTAEKTGMHHDEQWTHRKSPKSFKKEMGISKEDCMSEEEIEEREKKKLTNKIKRKISKKGHDQTLDLP